MYINEGGAGMWAGFSKGATMAKWKRKRRNAIKWRSAQNLQKHKRTHLHTNTGKYRQQMDTHATWAEQAGSEVGGRVSGSGNRGHRTLDIGNLQRTRKSCQWGAGHQEPAAGIPGPQDLFFLFSCKQSSVQLRRLSLLASAATASAERDSPLRPATHQPLLTMFSRSFCRVNCPSMRAQ